MGMVRSMSDLGFSIGHQAIFWIHESALRRWIHNPNQFVQRGACNRMLLLKDTQAFFHLVGIAHHSRLMVC